MADEKVEEGTDEAPDVSGLYQQAMANTLAASDKQTQDVLAKLLSGEVTESEAATQMRAVREADTSAGIQYGQGAGGFAQAKGFVEEQLKEAGASKGAIKSFHRRLEGMYYGKADGDFRTDLAETLRAGKGASAPRSAAGRRSDNEMLLDPKTPMEKVREIRSRQRKAEAW